MVAARYTSYAQNFDFARERKEEGLPKTQNWIWMILNPRPSALLRTHRATGHLFYLSQNNMSINKQLLFHIPVQYGNTSGCLQ
jgi:hypothetical protein